MSECLVITTQSQLHHWYFKLQTNSDSSMHIKQTPYFFLLTAWMSWSDGRECVATYTPKTPLPPPGQTCSQRSVQSSRSGTSKMSLQTDKVHWNKMMRHTHKFQSFKYEWLLKVFMNTVRKVSDPKRTQTDWPEEHRHTTAYVVPKTAPSQQSSVIFWWVQLCTQSDDP